MTKDEIQHLGLNPSGPFYPKEYIIKVDSCRRKMMDAFYPALMSIIIKDRDMRIGREFHSNRYKNYLYLKYIEILLGCIIIGNFNKLRNKEYNVFETKSEEYHLKHQSFLCGYIYFLTQKSKVVYVGKTIHNPIDRVKAHKKTKKFDNYFYIPVLAPKASFDTGLSQIVLSGYNCGNVILGLEYTIIRRLNPKYNKA